MSISLLMSAHETKGSAHLVLDALKITQRGSPLLVAVLLLRALPPILINPNVTVRDDVVTLPARGTVDDQIPLLNAALLTRPLLTCSKMLIQSAKLQIIGAKVPSQEERFRLTKTIVVFLLTAAAYFRAGAFLVADEIRELEGWRFEHLLTLNIQARTLMEVLFNVSHLLDEPYERSSIFRKHGWREAALDLDLYREEYTRLGGKYETWLQSAIEALDRGRVLEGISETEAENPRKNIPEWPSPGNIWCYGINPKTPEKLLDSRRRVLKWLYFRHYKPLSGEVHGNGYGQLRTAFMTFPREDLDPDQKNQLIAKEPVVLAMNYARLCSFFLCSLCEVQMFLPKNHFRLDTRLALIWSEIRKIEEYDDLFQMRYAERFVVG